jgi:hypothetical protein
MELNDLSLSQQAFPLIDLQVKDKQSGSDPEWDQYLSRCQKLVSTDLSQRVDGLDDSLASLLERAPSVTGALNFDRFRLILRTILRWVLKVGTTDFDKVACQIIERLVRFIPRPLLVKSHEFVLLWIKTTLRNPLVIRVFLTQNMLTVAQLDRLFTELLNTDPFNARNAAFVIKFLHYGLIESTSKNSVFSANEVMSSLSVLWALNKSHFDPMVSPQLEELQKLFEVMDAPAVHLSSSSKLQRVSTFDPIETMEDSHRISEVIRNWNAALATRHESEIEAQTRECSAWGKNLYVAFLFGEPEKTCILFVQCILEYVGFTDELSEAIIAVIAGNANVLGFDMRKFYSILRLIMEDCKDYVKYAVLLHKLRPLLMPSFAVDWIQLATDKCLIWALFKTQVYWPSFAVLLFDFAAILTLIDQKESTEAFNIVYRAFLRLILILAHDFREFLGAVGPALVCVIPFRFTQARNIILSASDRPCSGELIKPVMAVPSTHLGLLFQDGQCDASELSCVLAELDAKCDATSVRAFVLKVCEGSLLLKKSDDVEKCQAFQVLCGSFGTISAELTSALVNVIVDQVRYKCRESSFYVRLLLGLFRSELPITPQVTVSEVIVRIVMERAATPPPRPYKLGCVVRKLLATEKIWQMGFVMGNDSVRDFLVAAQSVFNGKQK